MADLNLTEIEDRINEEFRSNRRVIIFWYDDGGEFRDDVENLSLENGRLHILNGKNQFYTKVLLEVEDRESNYLVYADYPELDVTANHLRDMGHYSFKFSPDKAELIMNKIGIPREKVDLVRSCSKFFNAKDRVSRLEDLYIDDYRGYNLEIGLLSVLARSKNPSFDSLLMKVFTGDLEDNEYLEEFRKYNLEGVFWEICRLEYSYEDESPSLLKFAISLFLTYANRSTGELLAKSFERQLLLKVSSACIFLDSMKDSSEFRPRFRGLSSIVYDAIDGDRVFGSMNIEDYMNLDIFKDLDRFIVHELLSELLKENIDYSLDGMGILDIAKKRRHGHFKDYFKDFYNVLIYGYHIISNQNFYGARDCLDIVESYDKKDYLMDSYYRKFYFYLDTLEQDIFHDLEVVVENIYLNEFLNPISNAFTLDFNYKRLGSRYTLQRDFYSRHLKDKREKHLVIISDALRYEVAKEMVERFNFNEKIDAVIEPMISTVPSFTSLGMAALLPNTRLTFDDGEVLVDGFKVRNLEDRAGVLRNTDPNSGAINYGDLIAMRRDELREFFNGKSLVYVYHNKIDAVGDNPSTEDEVFAACELAMDEIERLIVKISDSASVVNYIVTSDHGFVYRRAHRDESDKIDRVYESEDRVSRRYILAAGQREAHGVRSISCSDIVDSSGYVVVPSGSNIFKSKGRGLNYYHGGASPQEVIIPLIRAKTTRGAIELDKVKVSPITMPDVNNLFVKLEFSQSEPVTDTVKARKCRFRFVDAGGEVISNEETYLADSRSSDTGDRLFTLKFNLKDQTYARSDEYYFVITDLDTGVDVYRSRVVIDIAFAGDFGF